MKKHNKQKIWLWILYGCGCRFLAFKNFKVSFQDFQITLDPRVTMKITNGKSKLLTGLHPKQQDVSQVGRPQDSRHFCMDIFSLCDLLSLPGSQSQG